MSAHVPCLPDNKVPSTNFFFKCDDFLKNVQARMQSNKRGKPVKIKLYAFCSQQSSLFEW